MGLFCEEEEIVRVRMRVTGKRVRAGVESLRKFCTLRPHTTIPAFLAKFMKLIKWLIGVKEFVMMQEHRCRKKHRKAIHKHKKTKNKKGSKMMHNYL